MLISDNIQIKIYAKNNFLTIIYSLSESIRLDLLIELRLFSVEKQNYRLTWIFQYFLFFLMMSFLDNKQKTFF